MMRMLAFAAAVSLAACGVASETSGVPSDSDGRGPFASSTAPLVTNVQAAKDVVPMATYDVKAKSLVAPPLGVGDADWYMGVASDVPGAAFSFGGFSEVPDPNSYPATAMVELMITGADGTVGTCSGTMIDSFHVLTAGHCLWSEHGKGWAKKVSVRSTTNWVEARTYSVAHGWKDDLDWDYDVALVYLEEPLGAVAGWLSYGTTWCLHLTDNDTKLYNFSFPAEGPHAGELMLRKGDFSWCPNAHLVSSYQDSYQGMSGSSYFENTSDHGDVVWAVHSHQDNGQFRAVRITDGLFESIKSIIHGRRHDPYDLVPYRFDTDQSEMYPEVDGSLHGVRFVVHNYSDKDWRGAVKGSIRLSQDDQIDANDTVIESFSLNRSIAAMRSVTISLPNVVVPASTPPGLYRVGLVLDNADGDPSNNVVEGARTRILVVKDAKFDLVAESVTVKPGTYSPAAKPKVTFAIRNVGDVATGAFTGELFLSPTLTAGAGSIKVATGAGPSLSPGQLYTSTVELPLTGISSGDYHVVVKVKAAGEDKTSNNGVGSNETLTVSDETLVGSPPDLSVDYFGFLSGTYSASDKLSVAFKVKNTGTGAGPWKARFYASPNAASDSDLVYLGEGSSGSLGGAESVQVFDELPLSALASGSWYLKMEVVTFNDVTPSNNSKWGPAPISIQFGMGLLGQDWP